MQKQRPILYSTPMVIAVQREVDPKTQTRRTKGLEKINEKPLVNYRYDGYDSENDVHFMEEIRIERYQQVKCPYGKVGDLLWVRESFYKHSQNGNLFYYAADYVNNEAWIHTSWKKKPSIHMPKAAARIWLQISDIKIERLKDISEQDAIAEGVERIADGFKNYAKLPKLISTLQCFDTAYVSFLSLWESINGYESSELNPWVWVITFKRVAKP